MPVIENPHLGSGRFAVNALAAILIAAASLATFAQSIGEPARQQKSEPATASISGVVVALGTGVPIAGAAVEARRGECGANSGDSATAITGADGKFVLEKLRAGPWCVGAAHPSGTYTPAEYQQRGYEGRGVAVPLLEAQKLENIDLPMAPTGSISGRVVDDDGEPLARVRVQVMRASYRDGRRRLYSMNVVQTNDRGEFHLFWLPPGAYYVAAIPEDGDRQRIAYSVAPPGRGGYRTDSLPPVMRRRIAPDGEVIEETYLPIYYGGGTNSDRALPIEVAPVAAVNGIQLSFSGAKMRSWHIRGTVPVPPPPVAAATPLPTPATGRGGQNPPAPPPVQLRLVPRDWTAIVVTPSAVADKDGNFDISGVPAGSYVLYASSQNMTARIPLEVGNANVENLSVVPIPPYRLTGSVNLDDSPITLSELRGLRVALARDPDFPGLPGATVTATVTTEGVFALANIPQGDYRVYVQPLLNPFSMTRASTPKVFEDAYIKAIRLAGQDVLTEGLHLAAAPENPLEVVLGLGGSLSGTVTDIQIKPSVNVTVALVPALAPGRFDLYRTAITNPSGQFQIKGIAPGEYRAFAWEEVADGEWHDESFIRAADARGKLVHIGEGMQSTTELLAISK